MVLVVPVNFNMGFLNFFKQQESPEPTPHLTRVFEDKETIEPEESNLPERGGYKTDTERAEYFEAQLEEVKQQIINKDKKAA